MLKELIYPTTLVAGSIWGNYVIVGRRLDDMTQKIDSRLDHMDRRLDHIEKKLDGMDKRMDLFGF